MLSVVASLCVLVAAAPAQAGDAEKCAAFKLKFAGKYAACRLSADSKAAKIGGTADYAKCDAKFAAGYDKADAKFDPCHVTSDQTEVKGLLSEITDCLATELTGGESCSLLEPLLCGNAEIDAGEDCDLATAITATCSSVTGGTKTYGSISCAADCSFDTSDCSKGAMVGGHEWFLATSDTQSCDAVCTAQSRFYDLATASFAGSGGTDENCTAVLYALGYPTGVIAFPSGLLTSGVGCTYAPAGIGSGLSGLKGVRDTSPTLSTSFANTSPDLYRACACQLPGA
jgi:hypothetical protein